MTTPGPWEIRYGRGGSGRYDSEGDERAVTSIGPLIPDHNHWDGTTLGVSYEDARLIAAAPELLEALEQAVHDLEALATAIPALNNTEGLVVGRAALKKAKGGDRLCVLTVAKLTEDR